ncbi:cytochrome c oxidase assembly factor 10 isoform X2 [Lasioglossum baleicum]|uniref:cytochrome c oxidase assembly factor 10 isoform X2 n=1 Tax=Lasioglossum baleicum TaxID=434251 RepID=UPI003FCCF660
MVFVFCSIRTTRNISCFSQLLRFPVATYSKQAAPVAKTSPSFPRQRSLTASKSLQPQIFPPQVTSVHDVGKPIGIENDSIVVRKDDCSKKELEWRYMELESDKLRKHCLMLSKIRLTSLVVVTTMAGYVLAPGSFDAYTFAACSIGTGLCSATANAINQFFEVPFDAQMSRTKNRVLVRGYLTPGHAIMFATVSGISGLSLLYSEVNGLTAALGAANLVLYTLIYTPMKRISILNTWVGSIVGAIPPLMGWAACVGDVASPGAWIMSGLLMMAVTDPKLCRKTALRYTAILTGLCYLAPAFDVTNWWFALESTPLNLYFLYLARNFYKHSDSGSSRKLFRFSLIHLPTLMILLLVNKKHWFSEKTQKDALIVDEKQSGLTASLTKFNIVAL